MARLAWLGGEAKKGRRVLSSLGLWGVGGLTPGGRGRPAEKEAGGGGGSGLLLSTDGPWRPPRELGRSPVV